MKLTEKLLEGVRPVWDKYLRQPFVRELGEGTLDIEKFRFYMIQDYRYLLEYARVFAIGITKTRDERLMRHFSAMLHDTLDGEMDIHKTYMERLGITKETISQTQTALANQSYTSYMLDIAQRGDEMDVLVAVLACAWSYEMIGEHHKNIKGALEHPIFGEWVRGYSSEDYIRGVEEIKDFINELGVGISPEREAYLTEIFLNCSRYERDFWDMAYSMDIGDK